MTRLRRLMEEELQRRNYSEITAACYLRQVAALNILGAALSCSALKRLNSFSFT